jgi:HAD superfamily hydrolase (TIGR01509 family)
VSSDSGPRIRAITVDFGNTLVPVTRAGLRGVVETLAVAVAARLGPFEVAAFLEAWDEERERQFRESVPQFREVDIGERLVRVLARLHGMAAPPPGAPWDQAAAGRLSDPTDIEWAIEVYASVFVEALPPDPAAGEVLAELAGRGPVAILSNWPLAATVDRYAQAAGWLPHLAAVVVSQRVGTIKPHPAIFAAARTALGDPTPATILHVGDDWAADVLGARTAGWRTAWLHTRPVDSPLPGSIRDGGRAPDLELGSLAELPAAIDRLGVAIG